MENAAKAMTDSAQFVDKLVENITQAARNLPNTAKSYPHFPQRRLWKMWICFCRELFESIAVRSRDYAICALVLLDTQNS